MRLQSHAWFIGPMRALRSIGHATCLLPLCMLRRNVAALRRSRVTIRTPGSLTGSGRNTAYEGQELMGQSAVPCAHRLIVKAGRVRMADTIGASLIANAPLLRRCIDAPRPWKSRASAFRSCRRQWPPRTSLWPPDGAQAPAQRIESGADPLRER